MDNSIQSNSNKKIFPLLNTEETTKTEKTNKNDEKVNGNLVELIENNEASKITLKIKDKKEIDPPIMEPDTATIILMNILNKKNEFDIKTATKLLKSNNVFTAKLNDEKLVVLKEKIEKLEEELKKKTNQQIGSDISLGFSTAASVFAFIGALFFTIVTGGLGVGALVGAGIGLTMTVLDVGTRIAKAAKSTYVDASGKTQPLDITLGGMVKRIVEDIAYHDKTYPPGSTDADREQKKSTIIMAVSIALNLAVGIAALACSVVSLKNLANAGEKIAKGIDKLADNCVGKLLKSIDLTINVQKTQMVGAISDGMEAFSSCLGAITDLAIGLCGIDLAYVSRDVKKFEILFSTIEEVVKRVQLSIEDDQETIKDLIETSANMYDQLLTNLANFQQSKTNQITMS